MIKNARDYKITKSMIDKFQSALEHVERLGKTGQLSGQHLKMHREANESILEDFVRDVEEYDELRKGSFDFSILDNIEQLPDNLIKARISLAWTQKEMAEKVGTTEQQIQKYEATNYSSASFGRIREIAFILKNSPRKKRKSPRGK